MICVECLSNVTSACKTKRKCIDADKSLRKTLCDNSRFKEIETSSNQPIPAKCEPLRPEHEEGNILYETVNTESFSSFILDPEFTQDSTEPSVETSFRETRQTKRKIQDSKNQSSVSSKEMKRNSIQFNSIASENIGKGFETILEQAASHQRDQEIKEYFCDSCSFVSKRKKNVERHILAVHMKSYKFNCPMIECDRQYTTQAALKLHCVRDHDESSPFECEKCKQKFSCESLLKIHKQRLTCRPRKAKIFERKLVEKSHKCPHCNFRTAHQFSLTQHVNLIHLNIRKTWKCSHCEITEFTSRISLNQHVFNVHKMLSHIRCPDCDQAFSTEAQLKSHKDSLKCNARQATERDYVESQSGVMCTLCNRNYRSKKEWITHYFNHHKFNKICDICNIQLSTYASLKNHKKTIHDKIKAFSCTECPKKFSAKHTLEFHLNTHSGVKPYGCKWCPFKASDRSSVSKHQKKIHHGMS